MLNPVKPLISTRQSFQNISLTQNSSLTQVQNFSQANISNIQNINSEDNSRWFWSDIRKAIGDSVPVAATLFLTIASLIGAPFLEAIVEPVASFLNWTSLLIIASDLPSIFEGIGESLRQIKEIITHPSFKGMVYVLSKIIPLYFIAELFTGSGLMQRILQGKKLVDPQNALYFKLKNSLKSKTKPNQAFANITSICEAIKAQLLNLGGNSSLRSAIWFVRKEFINRFVSHLPFHGLFKGNQVSPAVLVLMQSLASLWLALASNLLPRAQYNIKKEELS